MSFTIFLNFWRFLFWFLKQTQYSVIIIRSTVKLYKKFQKKPNLQASYQNIAHRWWSFAEQIPIKTKTFERAVEHELCILILNQFNFYVNSKVCLFLAFWRVFPSISIFPVKSKVCLFSAFWQVFSSIVKFSRQFITLFVFGVLTSFSHQFRFFTVSQFFHCFESELWITQQNLVSLWVWVENSG